jgi:hypothetical protein
MGMGGIPIPAEHVEALFASPGRIIWGDPIRIPLGKPPEGYHWEQVYPPTMRSAFAQFSMVPDVTTSEPSILTEKE